MMPFPTLPVEPLVQLLLSQVGGRYVYGGKVSSTVADPKARGYGMDCSGFVAWGTGRIGRGLLGGSGEQYAECLRAGLHIPVAEGIATRGAILVIPGDGAEHIAVSLGDGHTIEAHDTAEGIGIYPAHNRFSGAGRIPGFDYTTPTEDNDMTPEQVLVLEQIQTALLDPKIGMLARIANIERKLGVV
jgi:cell wall-associated NlpC family hydrolase